MSLIKTRPPLADPFSVELFCHSCGEAFDVNEEENILFRFAGVCVEQRLLTKIVLCQKLVFFAK